jgi:hypothetical protein
MKDSEQRTRDQLARISGFLSEMKPDYTRQWKLLLGIHTPEELGKSQPETVKAFYNYLSEEYITSQ